MIKKRKYIISYESIDGETKSFSWFHYVSKDVYAANLINNLNLAKSDERMIFRVDKYYDEANNKSYQERTNKQKQKAKEQYS